MSNLVIGSADILAVVKEYEGYHEQADGGTKFAEWYAKRVHDKGFANAAWCDMFLSWCSFEAGRRKNGTDGGEAALKQTGCFAYTPFHAQYFATKGRFGNKATVGAFAFLDWQSGKGISGIDHIEIVAGKTASGLIITYGGNVGNEVRKNYRSYRNIVGFGYPVYAKPGKTSTVKPASDEPTRVSVKAPRYPFRNGHVFGVPSDNAKVHSGTNASERKNVTAFQAKLRDRGWRIDVDGVFGSQTKSVVTAFQQDKGLEVDGLVGPRTWNAIWTAPIT